MYIAKLKHWGYLTFSSNQSVIFSMVKKKRERQLDLSGAHKIIRCIKSEKLAHASKQEKLKKN